MPPVRADPALYSSIAGPTTSLYTINGQPNPSGDPNESGGEGGGDDFNAGYRVINVTGMTFYGGDTDPNQTSAGAAVSNYGLQISFYSPTGVRIASIYPSAEEVYGIGLHTLSAGDFNQNGSPFIQTTGAGYVVFQPYYASIINGNTGVTYPAPTGTPQFTLGFGSVPTLGANDPTISVQTTTPGPGVVTTGVFNTAAGPTAQYGKFELDGTGVAVNSTTPLWTSPASGTWATAANWTLGVPNSAASTANFFEAITADATVTLSTAQTVGTVNFDNPLHRYTLAGPGPLTLSASSGPATLNGWGGSHTITCPVTYTAGLNVTAFPDPGVPSLTLPLAITATGTLAKSGAGTLAFAPPTAGVTPLNLPALTINAGTVALLNSGDPAKRTVLVTSALTLAGGRLDVGTNDADLAGAGTSGLATVAAAVQQGFAGGTWNGSAGVTSSAAAADAAHLTAVGVILNTATGTAGGPALYGTGTTLGLFDGQNPTAGDVLVRSTYYGDANLDGVVNAADYTRLDAGFVNHLTGWFNGDFNYDGVVDGSDYALIDNAFDHQTTARAAAQLAAALADPTLAAAVPEPSAVLMTLAAASTALLARRRRAARRGL